MRISGNHGNNVKFFLSKEYGTCFGRIVCSFSGDIFAGDVVDIGTATNCTAKQVTKHNLINI